jgi:hypothetical protein
MASFDTVYASQDAAYKLIWDKAQDAMKDLKNASAGGYIDSNPAGFDLNTLKYDPGKPEEILLKLPFNIEPLFQKIDDYIVQIKNVKAPIIPDAPNFQMQDHQIWSDPFAEKIKTSLSSYIDTMGIPDVTYQNAIFNEDFERNRSILNDQYDLADAKTGARGFTYTNDYGNGLKIDAQVKYQYDRTQVSRTISKTITEWARQNFQHATDKGIVLEQAHMDFTYKYCTAFVQIYKEMVVAALEGYKAQMEVILAPVNLLAKEVEIFMDYAKVAAEIDKTNETLKQSRSSIEIQEALAKYGHDSTAAITKMGQRLNALQQIAQHSSTIAQSASGSVIGITKK